MWRDLEEEAILMGLDLNYFWTLNPKQYKKYVKVFNEKEITRIKEQDYLNFTLGKYIAWAVNDPKHYPKKPFTDKRENKQENMTVSDMERNAMFNTQLLGGVINENR